MSDEATRTGNERHRAEWDEASSQALSLVVVGSSEPGRLGERFVVDADETVFGRGAARDDDPAQRLLPVWQRPGRSEARPPLASPFLSRVQLRITRSRGGLEIVNVGKCSLRDGNGRTVDRTRVNPGECIALGDHLLLLLVSGARRFPKARDLDERQLFPFGEPDEHGILGESEVTWKLRDTIAFLGGRNAHVLILGPSGSGKELVAQAIHRASDRASRRLVARNASTIPATLIEAELFGNAANYPNAGMPERLGLVGEADGSTLFLDEVGEISEELQTRLLRVLDGAGEYQRLGDARRRTADIRFIGATNRPVSVLRHDLAARLKLRLTLPGLEERREDISLLARHLMRRIAADDPVIRERFLGGAEHLEPRISVALMRGLLNHSYVTHVRELEALLWLAIGSSSGDTLALTSEVEAELKAAVTSTEVTAEQIKAALERAGGVREQAWRDLGLASRYVLKRLMKKYGIEDA